VNNGNAHLKHGTWLMTNYRDKFYAEAACRDVPTPAFFDQTNPNDIYALAALDFCRVCTVKLQCVVVMKPRESYFDGICGGKVWSNGKIVGDENGSTEAKWDEIDKVAVERLIKGELHWSKVTMKERKYAVLEARKQGLGVNTIMNIVSMSATTVNKLLKAEGII
jgi:hypothetical protein